MRDAEAIFLCVHPIALLTYREGDEYNAKACPSVFSQITPKSPGSRNAALI
jgi:hypothetical protein